MNMEQFFAYGIGFALIAVALARRSNILRARRIKGNIIVGHISGTVNQTYAEAAPRPSGKHDYASAPQGDRASLVIGIIGVLIATAQLVFDMLR
ncbi:MAG: hypothetical protein ACYDBA_10540 [Sulfuricaulis sp.]